MAIVSMSKFSLFALDENKKEILNGLMDLGVVQIDAVDDVLSDEEWSSLASKDACLEEDSIRVDSELQKADLALDVLKKYDTSKKPLIKTKTELGTQDFQSILSSKTEVLKDADQILALYDQVLKLKAQENKLNAQITGLEPFKAYDLPLEFTGTKTTGIIVGTIPATVDSDSLKGELLNEVPESEFGILLKDKEQTYFYVIYMVENEEMILQLLKDNGFLRAVFKDLHGTVDQIIKASLEEIAKINKELEQLSLDIAAKTESTRDLQTIYDGLSIEKDKLLVRERILKTKSSFYIYGWIPTEKIKIVETFLAGYACVFESKLPEEEEKFPVLLKNNGFVTPFEAVTELYSLPDSRNIDPTPFFSIFYAIFFGIMLSDAAYGIIIFLATLILQRKFKMQGMMKKMFKMFMYCGISTFFWGAIFGSWFGDAFTSIGNLFFGRDLTIKPLWFDPIKEPMKLLIFSLILGAIHLVLGMGLKAYILIRDGHPWAALFDVGSWYIVFLGIGMLLLPATKDYALYVIILGTVMLVASQGRDKKNIFGKFFGGLISLYGITSYFSDLLSYSRLLALGLATGVISSVVNTMGSLAGGGIVGAIVFLLVFIIGHVFNISINALGTFVHTNRLQYVEFFGKFFEDGGKAFTPFKKRTKYTEII